VSTTSTGQEASWHGPGELLDCLRHVASYCCLNRAVVVGLWQSDLLCQHVSLVCAAQNFVVAHDRKTHK
jgi:hypothetical protein